MKKARSKFTLKEGPGENQQLRGLNNCSSLERGPRENHIKRRPSRKSAASWFNCRSLERGPRGNHIERRPLQKSAASWLNCRSLERRPRKNHIEGRPSRKSTALRGLTVIAWKEALAKITSKEGPLENQQLFPLFLGS